MPKITKARFSRIAIEIASWPDKEFAELTALRAEVRSGKEKKAKVVKARKAIETATA